MRRKRRHEVNGSIGGLKETIPRSFPRFDRTDPIRFLFFSTLSHGRRWQVFPLLSPLILLIYSLAGFFKGTSADQDRRFSDKELKLLKSIKFPPQFDTKVFLLLFLICTPFKQRLYSR